MRRIRTADQLRQIMSRAIREDLERDGMLPGVPILERPVYAPITGKLIHVEYLQDDTPDIPGDNIECEYLAALRGDSDL